MAMATDKYNGCCGGTYPIKKGPTTYTPPVLPVAPVFPPGDSLDVCPSGRKPRTFVKAHPCPPRGCGMIADGVEFKHGAATLYMAELLSLKAQISAALPVFKGGPPKGLPYFTPVELVSSTALGGTTVIVKVRVSPERREISVAELTGPGPIPTSTQYILVKFVIMVTGTGPVPKLDKVKYIGDDISTHIMFIDVIKMF